MLKSIRWRIATAYVALILVTLFALSAYLLDLTNTWAINSLRASLTSQAHLVSHIAAASFEREVGPAELDAMAKRLGVETGIRITIIAADGTVLGDSHADPVAMDNHGSRPEIVAAMTSGFGYAERTGPTTDQRAIYVAVPIEAGGRLVGVARVSLPVSAVEASKEGIRRGGLVVATLASALAVALAIFIVRRVTQPVKELTRLAGQIARGNFDGQIAVTSQDEIGELAAAFRLMSTRLQDSLRSLSQEKTRLEAILANMADGIVITDQRGRVELGNRAAAEMLGWPLGKMKGLSLVQIAHDRELADALRACLETGDPQSRIAELGPRRLAVRALVTRVVDGSESIAYLVVLQDLTSIRRTEATRRDFVANVSHELRTPLASIKALVETLQAGALDDRATAERFLERMNVEVDNLTQLVRELLELSRIETGHAALKPEEVDPKTLLQLAVARLQAQADRAGLSLEVRTPDQLPPVVADPDRIHQVISNLLHNAIKFTPRGGQIVLSANLVDDTTVAFEVRDTGVGIPSEDLPRVFERFYKADKARTGGGTGLGLAIAKHIVQAHGGTIGAESVEGKGTTIRFTLGVGGRNAAGAT
ncbi:MAG: ATP-binding protein [Chloroflexota bacterium]